MHTPNTEQTEHFEYGITRTRLDDGAIVIIRTQGDMSLKAVDIWAETIIETLQHWDTERPLGLLNDLSHPRQGYTDYARQRTHDIIKSRPDSLTVYTAVVLPRTFMYHLLELFSRTPIFTQTGQIVKLFNAEADAIAWLHQQLLTDD